MHKIIVTGCGTGVGKTVVSAIVTTALEASYWKPIECGESDTETIKALIPSTKISIYPPTYSLKAAVSPHHAARLEDVQIDQQRINPPQTDNPLVIETAGGILVPLNRHQLTLDLFKEWKALWVVVSHLYLGSINHTLLTLEVLKQHQIHPLALIFNGTPNPDSEEAILHFSKVPCLGRLLPEPTLDSNIITNYANRWKQQLLNFLP